MKVRREQRLNSEFQKLIYEILKYDVQDNALDVMFSIVAVETTTDLKQAKVFVSIYANSEDKKQNAFEAMQRSSSFVRKKISSLMHIRTVPEFTFFLDNSFEYGNKIDSLLEKIKTGEKNDD